MDPTELNSAARSVLEILFASDDAGGYSVPRDFWEAGGEDALAGTAGTAEAPLQLAQTLTPLASLLRTALGEHVSLAEAAQRLARASRTVQSQIAEGRLRAIPADGSFLVNAADLPEA